MLIDGLWNMITLADGKKDPIKYIFHIVTKDKFRAMIEADPDATGKALSILDDIEIDPRLITHEPNDPYIINEQFIRTLIDNYNEEWLKYKPGRIERKYKDTAINFLFALYRNDSEYTSKMGGIISRLIMNREDFKDPSKNHLDTLKDVYNFWENGSVDEEGNILQPGEGRARVKPWIDWGFRYIINKYKKGNPFYVSSVNFFLYYLYVNGSKWQIVPIFYPENWYGNNRGFQTIALYGGNF